MSTTTATNSSSSSTTTTQRLQQRERERQQRGLQFHSNNSINPFFQIETGNVLFSEPIKHEHEDATAKRVKDTLGELIYNLLINLL